MNANKKLFVYNTLTKRKELFKPLEPGKVKIYTCGLTVNDYMHIGHARTYIVWDTIIRYLKYLGYEVRHVSNITDVSIDDKILRRVKELGMTYQQLVEKFTLAYFEDRRALGIEDADAHPLVTQHIQDIIEFIEKLMEKGYAYETEDGVYFSIKKFKDYGKLSGVKISKLRPGASGRVRTDEYDKAEVGDFALWKKAKPGEPYWYSPWGKGRPGWHIECSTLAIKYLGESIDIHAGGEDNIFPHHENEIAQSEALTGKQFAKYWLHTKHVLLNGKKMSKSEKNYITARDAIKKYGASLLRFHLLTVHYRSKLDFRETEIESSRKRLQKLREAATILARVIDSKGGGSNLEREIGGGGTREDIEKILIKAVEEARKNFEDAMNDDFNTPLAIKAVLDLATTVTRYEKEIERSGETAKRLYKFFEETGTILLGDLFKREIVPKIDSRTRKLIELILEEREKARKRGDYETSDRIREKLAEVGVQVGDTPEGPVWYLIDAPHHSRKCFPF